MEQFKQIISAAAELGIVTKASYSEDNTKWVISSDNNKVAVVFGQKGAFISASDGSNAEIYSNSRNAITRYVASKLFGTTDALFAGKQYKSVTVYPTRVINSGIEFSTASGKKFLVSTSNTRVTLGLYDILYSANGEQSIMLLPELLPTGARVDIASGYGLEELKPYMVSIKSELLSADYSAVLGPLVASAKDYDTLVKVNEILSDKSAGASCAPTKDALNSAKQLDVKFSSEDGYSIVASVNKGYVDYIFSGNAVCSQTTLAAALNQANHYMGELREGVSLVDEASIQVLASGFTKVVSTTAETVAPKCTVIKQNKSESEKICSSWGYPSNELVTSYVLEY